MLKLGDKVILHSVPFPDNEPDEVDTFVMVEVVETREVRGVWGQTTNELARYTGYRGVDDEGKDFFLNWTVFPDDARYPEWVWDTDTAMWFNVEHCMPPIPQRPKFMDVYPGVLSYCPIHKCMNGPLRNRSLIEMANEKGMDLVNACIDCIMDRPERIVRVDSTWPGWF